MNYYNDNDTFTGAWLRNLIRSGHLPKGFVSTRPIQKIVGADLLEFHQAHFFAGIGGWPLALRIIGWPEEREVWTGSCPCQPYSVSGKMEGDDDERNVWPFFRRLIGECHPPIIFGEQVAGSGGREWLAGVRADLEDLGYAVGAANLCAASVGAPHIRQRCFWMAYSSSNVCAPLLRPQDVEWSVRDAEDRTQVPNGPPDHMSDDGMWGRTQWSGGGQMFRRVEPGTFPLAHGVSKRVELLRGYGNSIVPQVAARFIIAALASIDGLRKDL